MGSSRTAISANASTTDLDVRQMNTENVKTNVLQRFEPVGYAEGGESGKPGN